MTDPKKGSFTTALAKSLGASLGLSLGMVGPMEPLGLVLLLLILIFRCRMFWAILGAFVGFGLTFVLETSLIGQIVLEAESLKNLWTQLYNTPLVALSGFNKTKVMGGLVMGGAAFPILFILFMIFRKRGSAPQVEVGAQT